MAALNIPEDLDRRLTDLAAFACCEKADVIRKLLDSLRAKQGSSIPGAVFGTQRSGPAAFNARASRERGAQVELGGKVIRVDSVRDLYDNVLRYLVRHRKKEAVRALLPYKTSSQRYLIADRPVHPKGNRFRIPVEHAGFFIEAHKPWGTGLSQLEKLLSKVGVSFRYVGNTGSPSVPVNRRRRAARVRLRASRPRRSR